MNALVEYPVPISEDRWAFVRLPSDLTRKDIDRVIRVLNTLMPDEAKVERANRPVVHGI